MVEGAESPDRDFTPPAPRRRFRAGWLGAGGAAVVLPKCIGCLLGYAALAGGPELCGAAGGDRAWLVAGLGGAAMAGVAWVWRSRSRE
jgi:hypothetical protein